MRHRRTALIVLASVLLIATVFIAAPQRGKMQEWLYPWGDPEGTHYSSLTTINRTNVTNLKLAWTWKTGEKPVLEKQAFAGSFEVTPLMINGVVYLSTPFNRVVALDASTGDKIWDYDLHAY